jgi:hypothetical protein
MATALTGTDGNDVIQPYGNSLALTVSGSIAEGIWPTFNVVVNGVTVLSNVTVNASHSAGATQSVSVPIPAGMSVSSLSIQYTNDAQTDYSTQDRNLYVESVVLNGHSLALSSGVYDRTGFPAPIAGQEAMQWGGSLNFSGSVVTSATPTVSGDVSVNGMGGIDTVVLPGVHTDYTVSHSSSGFSLTHPSDNSNITLTNVERVQFGDEKLALDVDTGGHANFTAELIAALFGKSVISNANFMAAGINLMDGGMSQVDLAAKAVATAEFQSMAGSSSNTDFVKLVYQHVVGSAPPASDLNFFVNLLDSGQFTQASLAVLAANSPVNQVNIVGIHDGVVFA